MRMGAPACITWLHLSCSAAETSLMNSSRLSAHRVASRGLCQMGEVRRGGNVLISIQSFFLLHIKSRFRTLTRVSKYFDKMSGIWENIKKISYENQITLQDCSHIFAESSRDSVGKRFSQGVVKVAGAVGHGPSLTADVCLSVLRLPLCLRPPRKEDSWLNIFLC